MALQIYNVLGREKQIFEPLNEGHVNMYVCGPTVYDHAHIGHAKTYVSFDVVVRYLRYSGYDVLYVQNLTDVGHLTVTAANSAKIEILRKARQLRRIPMQIVETYIRSYFADMDALGVHAARYFAACQRPHPRADRDDPGIDRQRRGLRSLWQRLF